MKPERPITMREISNDDERVLTAAIMLIGRLGGSGFQLRYSDDEEPVVWMALAAQASGHEVAASLHPVRAVLRLCERLADGGECSYCGRMTGLEPDELGNADLGREICWYVYEDDAGAFLSGCRGGTRA